MLREFDEREALRYAGVRGEGDEKTRALLAECYEECAPVLTYRYVGRELTREELFHLLPYRESKTLRAVLEGRERAYLFAATVGIGVDRLIARYAAVSPAKALLFQAIGAERIEALCDQICEEQTKRLQKEGLALSRRVSPGYGDFPLSAQREIFRGLDCAKLLGVSLTEGLLMSPTKSVTALAGIGKKIDCAGGCAACEDKNCGYRKE